MNHTIRTTYSPTNIEADKYRSIFLSKKYNE